MRVLFDTNVIISGFTESHIHHQHSLPWMQRALNQEIELVVSAHSIAEVFSVLTPVA